MMEIGSKVKTKIRLEASVSSNWPMSGTDSFGIDPIGGLMRIRFAGFDAPGLFPVTS